MGPGVSVAASEGLRVRPARQADLPAVSRLAAELVRLHHRLDPPRFLLVEPVEKGYQWFFTRELKRKGAVILVAERGREIVGYAYGTLEGRNWNDLLDACGKLNDIYVAEPARRTGAGRLLLAEMLSALRDRGAPRVVLLSAWLNPEAHAFFEAAGFRRTMVEMTVELPQGAAAKGPKPGPKTNGSKTNGSKK